MTSTRVQGRSAGQLCERVTQLRGEAGARHAIQENGGDLQGIEEAAVAIHVLSK